MIYKSDINVTDFIFGNSNNNIKSKTKPFIATAPKMVAAYWFSILVRSVSIKPSNPKRKTAKITSIIAPPT